MIEIRLATEDDVPAIVELADGLTREDAGQRDPFANVEWVRAEGEARFSKVVSGEDAACFIAVAGGEAVGFVSGRLEPPHLFSLVTGAHMGSLYVGQAHRGGGVGERLVEAFLDWAGTNGAVRVTVSTFASNEGARRFYERAGFEMQTVTLQRLIGPNAGG